MDTRGRLYRIEAGQYYALFRIVKFNIHFEILDEVATFDQ